MFELQLEHCLQKEHCPQLHVFTFYRRVYSFNGYNIIFVTIDSSDKLTSFGNIWMLKVKKMTSWIEQLGRLETELVHHSCNSEIDLFLR